MQTLMPALIALAVATVSPMADASDNLKAFPAAEAGMTRYVINLPKAPDESALRLELIVGKTLQVDGVNRTFLGGRLRPETIPGWGYTRYVLDKLGPAASTLMAPLPDKPKVERFVTLGGEPMLVRYNSRLPLVVYVPAEAQVRYRLWRADAETSPAKAG